MSSLSVFIAVTHLLGTGHLTRAAAIGRALVGQGHRVTLASGGRPLALLRRDGIVWVQLPPVHCVGTDFRTLWSADGVVADEALLHARRDALLAAFAQSDADVVVTELFPFGRRQLAAEMIALLEAARASERRPAVLCSIRDILNPPSRAERATEALERLGAFYDAVLVHGDEAVAPLSLSWPTAPSLERRLFYTGYIAEPVPAASRSGEGKGDILVTASGGAAGLGLYRLALDAAALDDGRTRWRMLVGHGVAEADYSALRATAPAHVIIERARPDFRELLERAGVVVAQAGYNTVVELAQAKARTILVPFDEGGEREQALRSGVFGRLGLSETLDPQILTSRMLLDAVRRRLAMPRPLGATFDLDGLQQTVEAVETAAEWSRERLDGERALVAALARARAAGATIRAWWRDDDAVSPSPALDRLLALRERFSIPLALAVIPATAEPALAKRLKGEADVTVLQHGFAHANQAPPGVKKTELGYSPLPMLVGELQLGAERLDRLFGARFAPVLVPPWNRIDQKLVASIGSVGLRGLSTFAPRATASPTEGILQVNTHWDPIAWRNGGGLGDTAELLGLLASQVDARIGMPPAEQEPLGLLTHHLVHDPWIWTFLASVLDRLVGSGVVRFENPWADLSWRRPDPQIAP